jgi:hypothetical protein
MEEDDLLLVEGILEPSTVISSLEYCLQDEKKGDIPEQINESSETPFLKSKPR